MELSAAREADDERIGKMLDELANDPQPEDGEHPCPRCRARRATIWSKPDGVRTFTCDNCFAGLEGRGHEPWPEALNGSSAGSDGFQSVEFLPLQELPSRLPPVPTLDPRLLPDRLRAWLTDIADRMQVPLEMVAAPAVVAASAVIGRRALIAPKRNDSWTVVPNLWGLVIERPGRMKTPAIAEALKPLRRLAALAIEASERDTIGATVELDSLRAQEAAIKRALQGAHGGKKGKPIGELKDELRDVKERIASAEIEARPRRYSTSDSTVEKLGELLRENPLGLLIQRDEIMGLLRMLEREDRAGDREFYLEGWNGDGEFSQDRIGRGSIHIPAVCLSVVGSTQPGKILPYVEAAVAGGKGDDGLLQRFQIVVWPGESDGWRLVDRRPDVAARDAAFNLFEVLDRGPVREAPLRFDDSAQELFFEWYSALEQRLRGRELEEFPAFESHLSKFRSLMPSLALIFQLAEDPRAAEVALPATERAAAWCAFLEEHARKLYAPEIGGPEVAAHALVDKIRTGEVFDEIKLRDVYQKGWTGLASAERVTAAAEVLERHGWAKVQKTTPASKGGRPSPRLRINPAVLGGTAA